MNTQKTLYIVRGTPGSGKSTFAKKLVHHDLLVCEADNYFINEENGKYEFDISKIRDAHKWCQNLVESYMKTGSLGDQYYHEIAVSNTFTQEWEMEPYFELAKKYGYRTFSVIVENRHGGVNQHGVPEEKIQIMKDRFQIKL
jgi:predicted kinase